MRRRLSVDESDPAEESYIATGMGTLLNVLHRG